MRFDSKKNLENLVIFVSVETTKNTKNECKALITITKKSTTNI